MLSDKKVEYGYLIIAFIIVMLIFLMLFLYAILFNKTRDRYTQLFVVARFPNKNKAGVVLYNLNNFGSKLLDGMDKRYQKPQAKVVIGRLLHKYDPDILEENDPKNPFEHKTYTTNFRAITMCIRKKNGEFYDSKTLLFVFMHELSHIGSLEREHNSEFWRTFKFLLTASYELGLYRPVDYSKRAIEYCGIPVNHSPFFENYDISDMV